MRLRSIKFDAGTLQDFNKTDAAILNLFLFHHFGSRPNVVYFPDGGAKWSRPAEQTEAKT